MAFLTGRLACIGEADYCKGKTEMATEAGAFLRSAVFRASVSLTGHRFCWTYRNKLLLNLHPLNILLALEHLALIIFTSFPPAIQIHHVVMYGAEAKDQ